MIKCYTNVQITLLCRQGVHFPSLSEVIAPIGGGVHNAWPLQCQPLITFSVKQL